MLLGPRPRRARGVERIENEGEEVETGWRRDGDDRSKDGRGTGCGVESDLAEGGRGESEVWLDVDPEGKAGDGARAKDGFVCVGSRKEKKLCESECLCWSQWI